MVRAPSCLYKFKEICVEPCNRSVHILEPSLTLSCICFSGENTTPSTATEDHGEWRWSCSPEQSATVGYRNQQQLWSGSRKHYWTRYFCFGLQGRSKDYILLAWCILIDMQLSYFQTVTRVWLIHVDMEPWTRMDGWYLFWTGQVACITSSIKESFNKVPTYIPASLSLQACEAAIMCCVANTPGSLCLQDQLCIAKA